MPPTVESFAKDTIVARLAHHARVRARVRSARWPLFAVCAVLAPVLTGCGISTASTTASAASGSLTLRVGALPSITSAVLYIAQDDQLFAAQHLTVQITATTDGAHALPAMIGGSFDVTTANYASAEQESANETPLDVVFDGIDATTNTYTVDVLKTSGITSITDLAGKTVGVSSLNDVPALALRQELSDHGVDPDSVHFVPVPFAQAQQHLANHQVDASVNTDPYRTESAQAISTRSVVDIFGIGTAFNDFPVAGYFATKSFVEHSPQIVRAFQRAMVAAAARATPQRVKEAVLRHLKINPDVASLMADPHFPTTLDITRLARGADLLKRAKVLPASFQIAAMVDPLPAN